MKIVYQNVVWLLIFVAYNYLCLADNPQVVNVGAFFDGENTPTEIAFNSVIYTTNLMQGRIVYKIDKRVVPKSDIFACSKIMCEMVEQDLGLGGIFGAPSAKTAPLIHSIGANLEIPHIQTNSRPDANFTESGTVLNFYPDPKLLSQGMAIIVQNLQWRSFVIIYDSDDGLIRLQDVLKIQQYNPNNKVNTIMIKQLGPGPDYRPLLKQIRNTTETRIILDCEIDKIIEVMQQAIDVKMGEPYYNYFLTSLDAHTLDFSVLNTTANITTVRIIDHKSKNFEQAVENWQQYATNGNLDMDLKSHLIKTETALMHDAVVMFTQNVNDLHVTESIVPKTMSCYDESGIWSGGLRIIAYMKLKNEPLSGITGPIAFDDSGRRINFTIYVVEYTHNITEKKEIEVEDSVIAFWNPSKPETLTWTRNTTETYQALIRRMKQGVLTISSRLGPPYLMERKKHSLEKWESADENFEGFSVDLIAELARKLDFKFKFKLAKDGKYGNYVPETHSWNGLIKDILDRNADLAICDLTINHQRREVVDFSMPFMRLGISILYKKAEEEDVDMFAFLNPFSMDVWIYTATLYLAISIVSYFVSRMSPTDWENPHPCDQNPEELENIWDLKNCLWLTLGAILCQGCDILPKGISSRMVASMWWFFAIIVSNSYMANLAAFLTMQRMEPAIDSAEALSKQTKIKYGAVTGGTTESFFRDSNYSTYQRMWTNMIQSKPSVFEKNNADGVRRVQNARQRMYAFLMESTSIEYEVETKCDLMQVGTLLDSKGYGIAMPIDYPYRSAINAVILELQENNVINGLKKKWWKDKRDQNLRCPQGVEEDTSAKLALKNVGGVFIVLGVGIAAAFVLAILEFLWNVRNVSVEEHITYKEALKVELLFALNIWVTKKKTKPVISESSSSNSGGETRSIAHSIMQGAGSFLHLNVLNKTRSPSADD